MILIGCTYREHHDQFMLWSSVNSQFDTVTRQLELAYAFDYTQDSIWSLTQRLDSLALALPPKPAKARVYFWKARYHDRFTPYVEGVRNNAQSYLDSAMSIYGDTASYPYDMMRLRYIADKQRSGNIQRSYFDNLRTLKEARELGDSLTAAGALNLLGIAHLSLGDSAAALKYFRNTCNIFRKMGMIDWEKRMQLSLAQANTTINPPLHDSLLMDLYNFTKQNKDTAFESIVLHNLYASSSLFGVKSDTILANKKMHYLREALNLTGNKPEYKNARAYYQAQIAYQMLSAGLHTDSAITLSRQAYGSTSPTMLPEYAASVALVYSMVLEKEGKQDSALLCLRRYVDIHDSLSEQNSVDEVMKKVVRHKISENANVMLRRQMRERTTFFSVLLAIIFTVGGGTFLFWRRHSNLKLQKMQSDLQLTRNQLQLAASLTVVKESENTMEGALDTIKQLIDDGKISAVDGQKVCSALKAQLTNHDELATFQEVYAKLHPDFRKRLLEATPGLSENLQKLAAYISIGLDNRQIARLMRIEYRSVITARYRLRAKLGLTTADSLEQYLREIGDEHH